MNAPCLRTEPELVQLRRKAEQFAAQRRERLTSAHLLAALADENNLAAQLLRERKLDRDQLLKAARCSTDDESRPLDAALARAREFAARMRAPEPAALHLLVALLSARSCAAYRVLDQFGIDVARLRLSAMNLGLGHGARSREVPAEVTAGTRASRAVSVPLTPPAKAASVVRLPQLRPKRVPEPNLTTSRTDEAPTKPAEPEARRPPPAPNTKPPARGKRRTSAARWRFALDPKRFKLLTAFGRNLCLEVEQGHLRPVVGRQREVEQLLGVLAKRQANNPCLVGAAGVGKTSVVHALAQLVVGSVERGALDDRLIVELSVGDLLAGAGHRGAVAERLGQLKKEARQLEGRAVLFLDEVHQWFAADAADELSVELKRILASGEVPCLGATTSEEYSRFIESDPVLQRRFTRVDIEEPTLDEANSIVQCLASELAEHHQIDYAACALGDAVSWSARYLSGRALPDKAIAVVDLAGARTRRRGFPCVESEQIAEVVAELSGVPKERLLETDAERLLRLEETLADRVVGHSEQLRAMARIIRRNAAGLGGGRPIGTFLLLGPTGVGKTESAKSIAAALFGSEQAMTRIDLSEYGEPHSVARLIGAPPGYVGHESGGQLTEAVRRRPYQVLLLDEIEKAHPQVLETFLPLFDEGRLTDGRARTVDFTNTVILLTSNIGAREAGGEGTRRVGFGQRGPSNETSVSQRVVQAARAKLAPEFFNRLDEVLVFGALQLEEVREIARRLLQKLADSVWRNRQVELRMDPALTAWLIEHGGFDRELGARPMKRAIARRIEAPLAERLLAGGFQPGSVAVVTLSGDDLAIEQEHT